MMKPRRVRFVLHPAALLVLASACGAPGKSTLTASVPARQASAAISATPSSLKPSTTSFDEPVSVGPRNFRVLGPLPNLEGPTKKSRIGLDKDYLGALGGEATARFEATTEVSVEGKAIRVREATLDATSTLDFVKLFTADTD